MAILIYSLVILRAGIYKIYLQSQNKRKDLDEILRLGKDLDDGISKDTKQLFVGVIIKHPLLPGGQVALLHWILTMCHGKITT